MRLGLLARRRIRVVECAGVCGVRNADWWSPQSFGLAVLGTSKVRNPGQSRAIQESAMQSGGARNALPVFSATGLGRLARREVCNAELRCPQ